MAKLVYHGKNGNPAIDREKIESLRLANAIQRISADRMLAQNLGRAGRMTVLEHFDGDKTALELAALFATATGGV